MLATDYDAALAASLSRFGVIVSESDARTLRRAEKTLRRWGERKCGDSYDAGSYYVSHAIERDENTGHPYEVRHITDRRNNGATRTIRTRVPDLERGALARVAEVCERLGFVFHHQTDPRGASLYVGPADRLPGPADEYYTRLTCCAMDARQVRYFLTRAS